MRYNRAKEDARKIGQQIAGVKGALRKENLGQFFAQGKRGNQHAAPIERQTAKRERCMPARGVAQHGEQAKQTEMSQLVAIGQGARQIEKNAWRPGVGQKDDPQEEQKKTDGGQGGNLMHGGCLRRNAWSALTE